ncbi:MAG: hypothetical protein GF417_02950, partial [Candidatus Latescibacteria bacterium]|nr:hypothetical protein [bacterium]MBD3423386.1 hypothetical protein [Candidatus Latescibacterota bacterium]
VELNMEIIHLFRENLSIQRPFVLQSELGSIGTGTDLIIEICRDAGANSFLNFPAAAGHLNLGLMKKAGIDFIPARYRPPVYPQLHGDFIYNLSALDMLMNCGPVSRELISDAGK